MIRFMRQSLCPKTAITVWVGPKVILDAVKTRTFLPPDGREAAMRCTTVSFLLPL